MLASKARAGTRSDTRVSRETTSCETVTRTLVQFAQNGLVLKGYRRLDIIDLAALRYEAGLPPRKSPRRH